MQTIDLNTRRKRLGMSLEALSKQSGVPIATVKRLMSGDLSKHKLANVEAVSKALGIQIQFTVEPENVVRERQAEAKARWLASVTQGTSALEGQAVDDATLEQAIQQTVHELMAGSNHRLWA